MKKNKLNSFFYNNIFCNKKVMIILPHQDDEINIAGGLLYTLSNMNSEIKIVYTTNGDFCVNASNRYREAIKSLKRLRISKENIIFMGYSDQPYDKETHMYNSDKIWVSHKNKKETYGWKNYGDWSFNKNGYHHSFSKNNFRNDLKDIIVTFLPDIIICIDVDFHPDHICTSLSFEAALGEILNEKNNSYYPVVLKAFAYENAYLAKEDFNTYNVEGMKFEWKNDKLISNPYYSPKDQIIFPNLEETYSLNLFKNPIWKAINQHKSQLLIKHAFSIMNSNNVFFQRNTNNIINKADVYTSSSNAKFLHDFMLLDSGNILNGNKKKIQFDKAIWIPEKNDLNKEIKISFPELRYIDCLKIYHGLKNDKHIKKIKVFIDGDEKEYELNQPFVEEIKLNKRIKDIVIKVLEDVVENGFSEIELLEKEYKEENIFIKCMIDNIWTNNFITNENKEYLITIYSINNAIKLKDIVIESLNLVNGEIHRR